MTSAPLSERSARRRFLLLTALRWLPSGLLIPVMVLLVQSRGLSLADVGLLFALHGVLVAVLELPTGGLADTFGRRPVLLLAAAATTLSYAGFAFGRGLPAYAAAIACMAVSRALSTGPLESWYVDIALAERPDLDLRPILGRVDAVDGAATLVGALAAAGLSALAARAGLGPDAVLAPLALPVVVGLVLSVVDLAAVGLLVVEPARPGATAIPRRGGTLGTVRSGLRLALGDPVARMVLLVAAVGGLLLTALEALAPGRLAELAGGGPQGAQVFAVLTATAFGATALGAPLGPLLAKLAGSSGRGLALACLLIALGVVALALSPTLLTAGIAYTVVYLLLALRGPLQRHLLHGRVSSQQRATLLSAESLALQTGGIAGSLAVPALAQATSVPVAWLVVACVLGVGGVAGGLGAARARESPQPSLRSTG